MGKSGNKNKTQKKFLEEKQDQRDEFAQFGQGPRNLIFDGARGDAKTPGDFVVGDALLTAHAEDALPLPGHLLHRQLNQQQQVAVVHVRKFVFGQQIGLPGEVGPHRAAVETVVYGIAGHAEQVGAEGRDAGHRAAVLPDFQEQVVGDVLGLCPVLEHAAQKLLGLRRIPHVEGVERRAVAAGKFFEQCSFVFHGK